MDPDQGTTEDKSATIIKESSHEPSRKYDESGRISEDERDDYLPNLDSPVK